MLKKLSCTRERVLGHRVANNAQSKQMDRDHLGAASSYVGGVKPSEP